MKRSDKSKLTFMEYMKKAAKNTKIKGLKKNQNYYNFRGDYGICFPKVSKNDDSTFQNFYDALYFYNKKIGISPIVFSKYHSKKKAKRVATRLNRYHIEEYGKAYLYHFPTGTVISI